MLYFLMHKTRLVSSMTAVKLPYKDNSNYLETYRTLWREFRIKICHRLQKYRKFCYFITAAFIYKINNSIYKNNTKIYTGLQNSF